jgi:trehalose synthase
MVAGEAGGIPMQMPAGAGGFLVDSVEECAEKLLFLLRNPEESAELARSGREVVRERFLLPRLISDELELYADLLGTGGPAKASRY